MGIQRKKGPSVEMRRRPLSVVLRSELRFVHAVRREHVQGEDPGEALSGARLGAIQRVWMAELVGGTDGS